MIQFSMIGDLTRTSLVRNLRSIWYHLGATNVSLHLLRICSLSEKLGGHPVFCTTPILLSLAATITSQLHTATTHWPTSHGIGPGLRLPPRLRPLAASGPSTTKGGASCASTATRGGDCFLLRVQQYEKSNKCNLFCRIR